MIRSPSSTRLKSLIALVVFFIGKALLKPTPTPETKTCPACLEVIESGRFDCAQVYYNAINPSAGWRRVPKGWTGGQDFCGVLAACFHQNG